MIYESKAGHTGGVLSVTDILTKVFVPKMEAEKAEELYRGWEDALKKTMSTFWRVQ